MCVHCWACRSDLLALAAAASKKQHCHFGYQEAHQVQDWILLEPGAMRPGAQTPQAHRGTSGVGEGTLGDGGGGRGRGVAAGRRMERQSRRMGRPRATVLLCPALHGGRKSAGRVAAGVAGRQAQAAGNTLPRRAHLPTSGGVRENLLPSVHTCRVGRASGRAIPSFSNLGAGAGAGVGVGSSRTDLSAGHKGREPDLKCRVTRPACPSRLWPDCSWWGSAPKWTRLFILLAPWSSLLVL